MTANAPLSNPFAEFKANLDANSGEVISEAATPPPDDPEPAASSPTQTQTTAPPKTTTPTSKRTQRKRKAAADKNVSVRMKHPVYEALHNIAHDNNMHLSTYVRAAISQYASTVPEKTGAPPRRPRANDFTRYSLYLDLEHIKRVDKAATASGRSANSVIVYSISRAIKDGYVPELDDDWDL